MSKVTKGARNVQIWRRTENHWHSTAGVMWQASSALMRWNNRGQSTDTDGELLAFITLHNSSCIESCPKEFAIGRGQEISLFGEWPFKSTLHNCSCTERSPKEFAIGRVEEISLSGGWLSTTAPAPGVQTLCYLKRSGNISLWWVTRPRCPPAGAVSTINPASLWTRKQLKLSHILAVLL